MISFSGMARYVMKAPNPNGEGLKPIVDSHGMYSSLLFSKLESHSPEQRPFYFHTDYFTKKAPNGDKEMIYLDDSGEERDGTLYKRAVEDLHYEHVTQNTDLSELIEKREALDDRYYEKARALPAKEVVFTYDRDNGTVMSGV